MRTSIRSLSLALLLTAACTAFGAGGGPMPTPSDQKPIPKSPQTMANNAYNTGVKYVGKGDDLLADAARQTDERKKQKSRAKAEQAYTEAIRRFERAVEYQSSMYAAWNYLGYSQRKLGHYEEALTAYDRALSAKPGYLEAIEYRGHAYLGLDRLSEAKEAYLTLFAGNRKLAASLLGAMQEWVGEHRGKPAGVDGAMLDSFAAWVNERSAIAGKTVSLTREGAAIAWK
jgi:tetratricopeptide (TPR) repeat protein